MSKEVLHVNLHRHLFMLMLVAGLNVTFMFGVFVLQCVSLFIVKSYE